MAMTIKHDEISLTSSKLLDLYWECLCENGYVGFLDRDIDVTRHQLTDIEIDVLHGDISWIFEASDDELIRVVRSSREPPLAVAALDKLIPFRQHVISAAQDLVADIAPPRMAKQCELYFDEVKLFASVVPLLPSLDFPAAVCLAAGLSTAACEPVAVAMLLYYLGISLFDDVIDHDLTSMWSAFAESEVLLTAMFLSIGPPLLAIERRCGRGRLHAFASSAFHLAFMQCNKGQFLDVSLRPQVSMSLDVPQMVVALKTGSTGRLAAQLGAVLAQHDDESVTKFGKFGLELYSAMQLASDVADIWANPISSDLKNGIATLPVVCAYQNLSDGNLKRLSSLIESKSTSESEHAEMRTIMSKSGSLRYCLLRIELLRRSAERHIDLAGLDPARRLLLEYASTSCRLLMPRRSDT